MDSFKFLYIFDNLFPSPFCFSTIFLSRNINKLTKRYVKINNNQYKLKDLYACTMPIKCLYIMQSKIVWTLNHTKYKRGRRKSRASKADDSWHILYLWEFFDLYDLNWIITFPSNPFLKLNMDLIPLYATSTRACILNAVL